MASLPKNKQKAARELAEATAEIESAKIFLQQPNTRDEDKLTYTSRMKSAEKQKEKAEQTLRAQDQQYNANKPNRPGYFRAVSPRFDTQLARPTGASRWIVLNDDRRENLVGRTLRPQ